jgi:septal ring factor EnvC (AmiA/AmiB activator)
MTPEQMQRTMEFIVEQQAKFATDLQQLFESDNRLREQQATLTAALVRLAELHEDLEKETNERFKKTDKLFAEVARAQKATDARLSQTDERLNIFINVVEEQLVRRRNGKKRRK